MYRWKAYNYRDIEQTFRLLGHTVDNIEQELGTVSYTHLTLPTT